jgi:5-hydroxyisourate hydrolase
MSAITTHVLDTALGKPAAGIAVELSILKGNEWQKLGAGATDADGRLRTLLPQGAPAVDGDYRLRFETGPYLEPAGFYPYVEIVFRVQGGGHYHVPLLLSPFGYSTYRGS